MARVRTWGVVACLLVTWLVAAPPANAAYAIAVKDTSANRSRTFHAYLNDQGELFKIAFRTTSPGEKRRIRARLEVTMPSSTSDKLLVTRQAIRCAMAGSSEFEQVYGVQNILRGTSMALTPRYTFTAGEVGTYECWLWVNSGRPLPSDTNVKSNVFTIGFGSYLHATVAVSPSSGQSFQPDSPSHLIMPGAAADESALTWKAPSQVTGFVANADMYITTCSVVGGSSDPVTGKRLCEGHTNLDGSTVYTRLVVGQVKASGSGYCALTYFPSQAGRKTFISRTQHHRVLYHHSPTIPVRTSSDCSRTFRIKGYVRNSGAAAVMVHRQGTITAALPD